MRPVRDLDPSGVSWLLCDVDGNLIPSEEPAFEASATVYNRLLASVGIAEEYDGETLRRHATGRNFRSMLEDLRRTARIALTDDDIDHWVAEENRVVIDHLSAVLQPDDSIIEILGELSGRYSLAAVSSSAQRRLDACFTAVGLSDLFPVTRRFSAQDSLPRPTSKPDPAVYRVAARVLGIQPHEGLAIEDAESGVQSAVGAGFRTIGNLAFVALAERPHRRSQLEDAGSLTIVESWSEIAELMGVKCSVETR
jgi:HAD superfamily hydrolase (TIGR01509 family)